MKKSCKNISKAFPLGEPPKSKCLRRLRGRSPLKTPLFFLYIFSLIACVFCSASPKKNVQSRDPFYLQEKKVHKKSGKVCASGPVRSKKIVLGGIMQSGENFAAVLSDGHDTEVVVVGNHLGGYLVKEIERDFVVLARGKKTKKLELD
jgi:hypothetical protein